MRHIPPNTIEHLVKQAKLFDEKAERAEVRRARAADLGAQREVEGALRTIEDAQESARILREKIDQLATCA